MVPYVGGINLAQGKQWCSWYFPPNSLKACKSRHQDDEEREQHWVENIELTSYWNNPAWGWAINE